MFRFKQFTIHDDRCAMKVGTDGVLLGAWASVDDARRILDVGAGSGLVALMMAQRAPEAHVTAIEIDDAAAVQACENVQHSPFADRVEVVCDDFVAFAEKLGTSEPSEPSGTSETSGTSGTFGSSETSGTSETFGSFETSRLYDVIVSNPPFFEEDLLPPDAKRANARHTQAGGLTFESLVASAVTLLREGGHLQVIIPKTAQIRFHAICNRHSLSLVRATDVQTVVRKPPKRVLLDFALTPLATPEHGVLVLTEQGKRSAVYAALCRDFYL